MYVYIVLSITETSSYPVKTWGKYYIFNKLRSIVEKKT